MNYRALAIDIPGLYGTTRPAKIDVLGALDLIANSRKHDTGAYAVAGPSQTEEPAALPALTR